MLALASIKRVAEKGMSPLSKVTIFCARPSSRRVISS